MENTLEKQISYITTLIEYLDGNEAVERAVIEKIDYSGLEIDFHTFISLKSNFNNFQEIWENTRVYTAEDYEEIREQMIRILKANQGMLITALLDTEEMDELIEQYC